MPGTQPYAIVCCFKYVAATKKKRAHWKLVDSYGIDNDGYAITKPKHPSHGRNQCWRGFTEKRTRDGYDPIDGRLVTMWTWESGVSLLEFNPPEPAKWISMLFYHKMSERGDWKTLIDGAHSIMSETASRVKEMLTGEKL